MTSVSGKQWLVSKAARGEERRSLLRCCLSMVLGNVHVGWWSYIHSGDAGGYTFHVPSASQSFIASWVPVPHCVCDQAWGWHGPVKLLILVFDPTPVFSKPVYPITAEGKAIRAFSIPISTSLCSWNTRLTKTRATSIPPCAHPHSLFLRGSVTGTSTQLLGEHWNQELLLLPCIE